jgi:hypothetical protein
MFRSCKRRFRLAALVGGIALAGCGAKSPPDPNDADLVGILQPEVLQRNLRWASDMVNDRVAKQEIDEEEGKKLLAKYAGQLVEKVDFDQMRDAQAWQYGDIFRTARRWDLAEKALERAVAHAEKRKNQDRFVNDTLRLAQCQANLNKNSEALATARSTFAVSDKDKAPILLAVLYEITPALRGKGVDAELARLIEDSIGQHMAVVVDPKDESGQAFLAAKSHHLRNAWQMAIDLYGAAGDAEAASAAAKKRDDMLDQMGRL